MTAQPPADPGCVTILRPVDSRRVLTKTYSPAANGKVVKTDFGDVAQFRGTVEAVADLAGLHRLLVALETDPTACVIRGGPKPDTDLARTRRTLRKGGGAFADVPRSWVMLDLDGVPLPAGMSVLAEPQDVARHLADLVTGYAPELADVSCIVSLSSSAGIGEMAEAEAAAGLPDRWSGVAKPGNRIGAHLWFWLAEPQDGPALDRWAKAINATVGHKAIDPATLNAIQIHYTAAPLFAGGLRDPLAGRRTLLVQGLEDVATLVIPAEAPHGSTSGSGSTAGEFAGLGFGDRLDLIGHPVHGFHKPINSAIGYFIATNWPEPDTAALVSVLQERIRAADPGARSQSEIDRYADADALRERVQWAVDRQREGAASRHAEQAKAPPIEPTFPDRGVPLAEGQRQAAAAVAAFARQIGEGNRPDMLLRVTVGGGKSEGAIKGIAEVLEAARGAGREGALFYLVPRHDLGSEIASRIAAAHPGKAIAIWRGMEAADPAAPGKEMCHDPEIPKASAGAGLGASAACGVCPLLASCGYRRQAAQRADIWIAAHQLGFQGLPKGLPKAAAVVVDEAFWPAALKGMDGLPIQLALSSLDDERTGTLLGLSRDRLLFLRHLAARALERHERGGLLRSAFDAVGFTAEGAAEWAKLEWATKPDVRMKGEGWSRDQILEALADAGAAGFSRLRAVLATYVRKLLEGTDARSINATFEPEADFGRNQGSGPAVRFAWREDFAEWAADAPRLFLDATTHPDVVRTWCADLEVVDVEIAAPHQHVRQVTDREFGRTSFKQNPGNVARLADLVVVELAEAAGAGVLVVAQQAVEDALHAELLRRLGALPAGLHLAHHGALTGMDKWRGVARVVVVGRPAMNRTDGERLAEIVRGGAVDRVQDGHRSRWPSVPAGIRLPDGKGAAVDQPRHPDALVEALRWSITEGAVLQAIGRGRAVQRGDKVTVTLLAALALPLTVATVATWSDVLPDRLTVAEAEAALTGRALPLAPADMAAARPDLWPSEAAARKDLERTREAKGRQLLIGPPYKRLSPFSGLKGARYRKPGGRRWSEALVPVEGGEAALAALVGPLAAFELVKPAAPPIYVTPPLPGEVPAPPPVLPVQPPVLVAAECQSGVTLPEPGAIEVEELPPAMPAGAADRLAHLSLRLDLVRPPRMHGDGMDLARVWGWEQRQASSRARWWAAAVGGMAREAAA